MLKDILAAERIKRETAANHEAAQRRELDEIIAGVQGVFMQDADELRQLKLKGDYGKPVHLVPEDCLKRFGPFDGIRIDLGKRISPAALELVIFRHGQAIAPLARLQIIRTHPYKSEVLGEWPGHTPPDDLVAKLLKALAPNLQMEV